jgi:hypothetical protein
MPALVDYDDGEIGGMLIGRGNRSTRRKRALLPLCPPQTPHACPDANPGSRGGKSATNRIVTLNKEALRHNLEIKNKIIYK